MKKFFNLLYLFKNGDGGAMQLLLNDRWKYEICFDNAVLDEVRSFSGTLKDAEKVFTKCKAIFELIRN